MLIKRLSVVLVIVALLGAMLFVVVHLFPTGDSPFATSDELFSEHVVSALYDALEQTGSTPVPNIIVESLREGDVDGDGDFEVVGFAEIRGEYVTTVLYVWHKEGDGFVVHENGDPGFSYGNSLLYEHESCSVTKLEVYAITLTCEFDDDVETITIKDLGEGQEHGIVGYYQDVDTTPFTFTAPLNWQMYTSVAGGLAFMHPADVDVTERMYVVHDKQVLLIQGSQGDTVLFEVQVKEMDVSEEEEYGFSSAMGDGPFIQRGDGTYLQREQVQFFPYLKRYWTLTYNYITPEAVDDASSVFTPSSYGYLTGGGKYRFLAREATYSTVKTVDAIFATVTHPNVPAFENVSVTPLPMQTVSVAGIGTVQIQAELVDAYSEGAHVPESALAGSTHYTVKPIDSSAYDETQISFHVYPYGNISNGRTGFDASSYTCLDRDHSGGRKPPVHIGAFDVCRVGFGDAGLSVGTYYLLDQARGVIIHVINSAENYGFPDLVGVDVERVIESFLYSTN
jgi:hypothetical protein